MLQIAAKIRRWHVILVLAALLSSLFMPAASADAQPNRIARAEIDEPLRLLVQFQNAPLADTTNPMQVRNIAAEQKTFRSQMKAKGIQYQEHSTFSKLWNGMAITASTADLAKIRSMRGVTGVFISHKTAAPAPMLASSTVMIGADKAWVGDPAQAIPGVDGTGITVAVIDTGIDYTHPDLGGCFGAGCRVIGGWDFVGADFDGTNLPQPGPDVMDLNGHGTHVAGIIGAKAASETGVTGVAPGVNFVALKVFGAAGSTYDDIILQAMEMAYDMRVDVINMSLGAAFDWPQSPTAQATERLAKKGIFLSVSAGNSGPSGEYAVGSPATGTGAIAVASFENNFVRHPALLDPAGTPIAYEIMTESPAAPTSGVSPELVYVGLGAGDADFLNADGTSKVDGKVALISRGTITFQEKTMRAQQHGAVATIIFNNAQGFFLGTLGSAGDYVPTISISKEDGEHLLGLLNQGPVTVTWTDTVQLFNNPTAGFVSDFSSWGPTPDLAVKPDLTAPGGSISSTYPVAMGSYATLSGTSMAAPHVAGAAALVLQARREMFEQGAPLVKATSVRNLLMNTAVPRTVGPDAADFYPVHRQGAGLIDVWAAVSAKQRVWPDKLALGEREGGSVMTQKLQIQNLSDADETFTFSAIGAGVPAMTVATADEAFTVPARSSGSVKLDLTVPTDMPDGGVFSGWIEVKNGSGETVAHVPYLGFKGDYQAAPVLDPLSPFELPWLAYLEEGWLIKADQIEIHPFCLGCDNQYAWLIFSLARQTPELKVEIWDPTMSHKYGNVLDLQYLARDDGGMEMLVWDGFNDKWGMVPAGSYVLKLMALKPLGDPRNPSDWDTWTTGPITVVWD